MIFESMAPGFLFSWYWNWITSLDDIGWVARVIMWVKFKFITEVKQKRKECFSEHFDKMRTL